MKKCATGGMMKALAEHAGKPASKAHKGLKAGGAVKMAKGGSVKSSASRRADGAAQRGRTKGRTL